MRKWRAVCCRSHCLMPGEPLGLGPRGCVAQREGAGGRGHRQSACAHVCVLCPGAWLRVCVQPPQSPQA